MITYLKSLFASKHTPIHPLAVGGKYSLNTQDPWNRASVEIVDLKDGWVRYKFSRQVLSNPILWSATESYFRTCYELISPEEKSST